MTDDLDRLLEQLGAALDDAILEQVAAALEANDTHTAAKLLNEVDDRREGRAPRRARRPGPNVRRTGHYNSGDSPYLWACECPAPVAGWWAVECTRCRRPILAALERVLSTRAP